ncbi:MAG TPA: branched-chain amino acid ABC transporter permease [Pseudolabrys sp.]|jgi:branched-chain amino acid transport system permease protein|nr:branched-chain amino acid ABC transporter permease [Pseudolabrys sp.]
MKGLGAIAIVVAVLAAVPLVVHSNTALNFLVITLLTALAGQGWNILGGYGGQYSFGHAAFFGTGAYITAVLQVRYGVNAWPGFAAGIAAGALVGAVIGALTFRAGLRGSYFALVTLAFAEVLRIIASVAPITGAGVGTLIKLDLHASALQFESRAVFYWVILALLAVSLVIARVIENSRFGAWLIAVRENEDAARALGVDAFRVKLGAMTISAAITAAAGCFYAQYFLFIDSSIAFGTRMSIEALLTPIIGGAGTVFGPLVGALVVKALGEAATYVAGDAPGLNLIVYGCVLVLVIAFAPRGLIGFVAGARRRFARGTREVAHG